MIPTAIYISTNSRLLYHKIPAEDRRSDSSRFGEMLSYKDTPLMVKQR